MDGLRIGDAARTSGMPASTLRYYEKIGLLRAPRTDSGYRVYDQRTLDRLAFVRTVRHVGLPLPRIRELLRVWDDQPCRAVQTRLCQLVDDQLLETRARIAELQDLERQLEAGRARLRGIAPSDAACDPACPFQRKVAA